MESMSTEAWATLILIGMFVFFTLLLLGMLWWEEIGHSQWDLWPGRVEPKQSLPIEIEEEEPKEEPKRVLEL